MLNNIQYRYFAARNNWYFLHRQLRPRYRIIVKCRGSRIYKNNIERVRRAATLSDKNNR